MFPCVKMLRWIVAIATAQRQQDQSKSVSAQLANGYYAMGRQLNVHRKLTIDMGPLPISQRINTK
jgi:hypothetical protein